MISREKHIVYNPQIHTTISRGFFQTQLQIKLFSILEIHTSPVHVVLVSLLVDQLSGLFLIFLVDQKKEKYTRQLVNQETDQNHMDGTSGNFWSVSDFLVY